jgi:hypothetical protein
MVPDGLKQRKTSLNSRDNVGDNIIHFSYVCSIIISTFPIALYRTVDVENDRYAELKQVEDSACN